MAKAYRNALHCPCGRENPCQRTLCELLRARSGCTRHTSAACERQFLSVTATVAAYALLLGTQRENDCASSGAGEVGPSPDGFAFPWLSCQDSPDQSSALIHVAASVEAMESSIHKVMNSCSSTSARKNLRQSRSSFPRGEGTERVGVVRPVSISASSCSDTGSYRQGA